MPGDRIEIPARAATGEPAQLCLRLGSVLTVTGLGLHRGRGGLVVDDRTALEDLHRALGELLSSDVRRGN